MFDDVLDIIYEIKIFINDKCIRKHYCVRDTLDDLKETCNNYLKSYNKIYPDDIISIITYDNNKNTTVYSITSTEDL